MKKVLFTSCLFLFSIISAFAQPANDACAGAVSVTPNGTCVNGTTVLAADHWTGAVGCQSGANHPEVWYTFVSTGTQADFTVTNGTMTGNIEVILVESVGPCAGLTLAGSDCAPSPLSTTFTGLTVGTTYYYTISSSTSSQGTFTACVTTSSPPPVSGQDCATAAILCNNNPFSQGSSSAGAGAVSGNASNENLSALGCLTTDERQSKWYKFTIGCTGTVEFIVNPVTNTNDYDWAIYDITSSGCALTPGGLAAGGATQVVCNYSGCPGNTGILNPATDPCTITDFTSCAGGPACNAGDVTQFNITPPTLTAGHTYALIIDNFSLSNSGFAFSWLSGGTAIIGPDAGFTYTNPSCGVFNFTKSCSTINTTFDWNFGDGATSTLQNPSHTYAAGGTYIISLTVTDALGCSTTTSQTVSINTPAATATPAAQILCSGATTAIALTSSLPSTTFSWTVTQTGVTGASAGSGSSIAQTLSLTGAAAGTAVYTVTPVAAGCTGVPITVTITVNPSATIALTSAAGTDAQTVCVNTPINNIVYTIGGNATAASVTGLPGGVTGTLVGNVFTITGSPSATGTFNYTVTATGTCLPATATGTITVNPASTITLTSAAATTAQTVCINTAITNITYAVGGSATGATVAGLPAGVTGSFAGGVFTISGTPTTSTGSPFTYTVTTSGPCAAETATGIITVNPASTITLSSAAGTNAQTVCINTPITNITYAIGGSATGASVSGLPTGVTGSFAAGVFTITGTPSTTTGSPFTYTVTTSGPCAAVTATGTITVNPASAITLTSAATTNAQTVCVNTAITNITYAVGGSATGATIAGLPAGVTGSFAAGVFTISGTPSTTVGSPFTYTVTTSGPCAAVTATGTVTVNPASSITLTSAAATTSQTVCINTAINNITYAIGGSATGASVSGLPTGVTGSFAAGVFTISGTPSTSTGSPFTYTVTTSGPCAAVTATGSITVTPIQSAAFSYSGSTFCQTGTNPTPTITGVSGGTFGSTAGLVFVSTGTGQINLSGSSLGTYTITYTTPGPCPGIATFSVTITTAPSAAFSYAGPYCQGGTNPSPTFGAGASGGTFSSTTGLNFVSTGTGQINLATSTPGTYTVTNSIAAAGGCSAATATTTVTIDPIATADAGSDQDVCYGTTITLAGTVGGGATTGTWSGGTGTFTPDATTLNAVYTPSTADSTAGAVTLTLTTNDPAGPCGVITDQMVITITPPATVNANVDQAICYGATVALAGSIGGGATSATWSGGTGTFTPDATTLNAVYTPSAADSTAGAVTLTLTTNDPAGPCALATDQMVITITPPASVNANVDQAICYGSTVTLAGTVGGGATTGTWSGGTGTFSPDAITLNAVYTPSAADSTAGSVTLTLTTNDPAGPCALATDQMVITITPPAIVNANVDQSVCYGSTVTLAGSIGGGATSATWSGGTGTFSPDATTLNAVYTPSAADSTAGSVTLTLTSNDPAGPCTSATDQVVITIMPSDNASFSYPSATVCATGANPVPTVTGLPGGTFTTSGVISIDPATGVIDLSATALNTYTITYTTNGACPNSSTFTLTISSSPSAAFSYSGPYCQSSGGTASPVFSGTSSGGVFSSSPGLSLTSGTGAVNVSSSTPGTYTVYNNIAASGGCAAALDSAMIVIDQPATAFAGNDTAICAGAVYSAMGSVGGSATSFTWGTAGSGTFSTTTYTPSSADSLAGSVQLYIMSNDPANSCGAVNDTLLLTISLPPNVDAGTMQSLACGAATTVLTGSSTALSPSFNWSGPGIVSGGSTASATVNATGLYTLTVTSGNCSNTDTVSVISNINAPNVDAGAADTLTCITLTGSLTGTSTTAGAQFSWSGPSIVSGGSTATPTVNAAGVYTLTVTDPANNCTATDTVVVENITTPPNANAGSGQTITCSATSVVLNGSSTTAGTSFSWSGLGIVSGGSTATPTVNAAGTYTVTVTDGVNGCSATSTVVVASNTIPPTADAGPPQPIGCGIIAAILDGSASSTGISITYTWTTTNGNIVAGTNSITPTVDAAGSYTVTVTNTATGCSSVDSVLVVAAPAPSASFSSNPMSGTSPLPVDFTNTSTLSNTYVWNFGDGSALVSTANPSYVYTSPGTYTVTLIASNNNGCPDTATSTIIVFDDFTVVIPNIFTPNGDNNNDQFKVSSTGVESLKGEIYDRWGLKLYDWNQINEGWDGRTQSGVVVVDGTYYYIITLKAQDGKEHLYKGFIQLLSK